MGSLVSLVMSDIVDSTRRWNAAEGAMAADLELHDRLIRDVVEGAGGSVFKHTGDGMIAVFDDPVAAAGAATGIQQAIGTAQWQQPDGLQVRAAVHSGVVYPRDGDLFGTAVNKLARILGVCPPGAVLVSNVVAGLLAERAPEGVGIEAVGAASLAGFSTPEALHALIGGGMAVVDRLTSSPVDMEHRGGPLPPIDEEMIGRSEELAAIWDGLSRARLVTLVGVGGMGKTRLAMEVAAGSVATFAGGVWWIDLSTASGDEAVVPVALGTVGGRESAGRTALESFCDRLAGRNALIVLDNCEHVLGAARQLVQAVRVAAPEVRVVATSREALGVRGEHLVAIGSLPDRDGIELFIERALAVRPDLDLVTTRPVIERLATRLDGIPLAIELAAARCRSMTPTEIDALLGDRFRLLRGGRSGAERHRTLQAAVAWSYELLDPDERTVFLHLAVFAGGTLVDGLADVTGLDLFDVLDIVDRLIARSMVVATATPLGTRYHQLETLRQFAEDRLIEAGRIDEVRARHLAWVHDRAIWIGSTIGTPDGTTGFRRFCAEVDNLRVAVAHAAGQGRHHLSHEIVAAVVEAAGARPALEAFDWVRPIQLEGEWTDEAATCVAVGAWADIIRGIRSEDDPIGGVPEQLLAHPIVASTHALTQSSGFGRWDTALDVLARTAASTDRQRLAVEGAWLMAQYFRQLAGSLSDHEFAEVHTRATTAVDFARSLDDEAALSRILWRYALAVVDRRPDEAFDLAAETINIAERMGAEAVSAYATSALHLAAVRRTDTSGSDVAERAVALRKAINGRLRDGQRHPAGALTFPAFALIGETDPDAAVLMCVVWRRLNGVDTTRHLQLGGVPIPTDWSEWEQRAADLTLVDAIGLVLAALDRVIVAVEASAAAGGEG